MKLPSKYDIHAFEMLISSHYLCCFLLQYSIQTMVTENFDFNFFKEV